MTPKNIIIISISSDIGTALANRWIKRGWNIVGTYKTLSKNVENLQKRGCGLVYCDLLDENSILDANNKINNRCNSWDVLILCTGRLSPIGSFENCKFDDWEDSIKVNFINQIKFIHALLPNRNKDSINKPAVITFAGGGTNKATYNYSAYTVSKIALIKMTELLDAEIQDTKFTILGPGWVKTKIHEATISAGKLADDNFQLTLDKLANNECTPLEKIIDCFDWVIETDRKEVSGRNFSIVHDGWGTEELTKKLLENSNMFKLRRFGNE